VTVCLCCILLMTIVKCIFLFSNVSSKIINFETAAQVLFKLYRFKGLGGLLGDANVTKCLVDISPPHD
jgi:hypothetical protein